MSQLVDVDDSAPIADRHLRNIPEKRGDLKVTPAHKLDSERFVCGHGFPTHAGMVRLADRNTGEDVTTALEANEVFRVLTSEVGALSFLRKH
ncbi:hypothetical protein OMCYN_01721 [cyanobiont of Ornithocercus magnificus]|nr:hypothetical protein OMCYN_01721 [cyanobiont of Ornithocercus magnificus]